MGTSAMFTKCGHKQRGAKQKSNRNSVVPSKTRNFGPGICGN